MVRSHFSSRAGAGPEAFGDLLQRRVGAVEPAFGHGLAQRSLAREMAVDAAVADIERTGNVHHRGLGQPIAPQHVLGDLQNASGVRTTTSFMRITCDDDGMGGHLIPLCR